MSQPGVPETVDTSTACPKHAGVPVDDPLPPHRIALAKRIRTLRRERGVAQERLAQIAGVDRSWLGTVERGQRNVSLDQLAKIALALDVPLAELFADEST